MADQMLIKNATIINEGEQFTGSILIEKELIREIYRGSNSLPSQIQAETIDATGQILIPGVIDDQVHFRDPGLVHKGSIKTESKAALAGGVTSFMDMPNTLPQAITQELLEQKYEIASANSSANYSFYMGATNTNLDEILCTNPETVCGIKVFMGSSTGNMLVDDPKSLERIFSESKSLIAVHCEDEQTIQKNILHYRKIYGDDIPVECHPLIRSRNACYKSSSYAVELAKKHGTRLHLLHLSTSDELALLDNSTALSDKKITAEVCVHHLWFCDEDYSRLGNLIKWNPAIKSAKDREALFKGVLNNLIDVIATDHAPHTIEEKNNTYFKAPAGGPLIQHSLQIMLEFYHRKMISLEKIVEKMCHAPAEIFKIDRRGYIRKGHYADLVLVDLHKMHKVTKDNIMYKCKWSPFEGIVFNSSITHTFVNGGLGYKNGRINEQIRGKRLRFNK
jgi:dihydroorotase